MQPFPKPGFFTRSWFSETLSSMINLDISTKSLNYALQGGNHIVQWGRAFQVVKNCKVFRLSSVTFTQQLSPNLKRSYHALFFCNQNKTDRQTSLPEPLYCSKNLMHKILVPPPCFGIITILIEIFQYCSKTPSAYSDLSNITLKYPSRKTPRRLSTKYLHRDFKLHIVSFWKVWKAKMLFTCPYRYHNTLHCFSLTKVLSHPLLELCKDHISQYGSVSLTSKHAIWDLLIYNS